MAGPSRGVRASYAGGRARLEAFAALARARAVVIGLLLTLTTASAAFRARVKLPTRPRPRRRVLFYNPRSGGGKAERVNIATEARAREIEPVELTPGTDLEELVHDAVSRGADALAMAAGDGSPAVVAAIAAANGLPYACVPAGTRNRFALDLGVDRADVVGALDALIDGGERVVDLAEVNGRVFVNNVSLGIHGEAVQRHNYRDGGPDAQRRPLRWSDPAGRQCRGHATVLVSNNRYRVGTLLGSGTRPSLNEGLLGIIVVDAPTDTRSHRRGHSRPWRQWTARSFTVQAPERVRASIDGEAAQLQAPLRFASPPGRLAIGNRPRWRVGRPARAGGDCRRPRATRLAPDLRAKR